MEQGPNIRIVEVVCVVYYLLSHLGVWATWRYNRKGALGGVQSVLETLSNQALLLGLRAAMRMLVGFAPLMPFQIPQPSEAENLYGLHRYQSTHVRVKKFPRLPPGIKIVMNIVFGLLGGFLTIYGRRLILRSADQ